MSELVECPNCAARIDVKQELHYDQTVSMNCPYCGGNFDYVPGFGALSSKESQAPNQRPVRLDGSQTARPLQDPVFAVGRANPLPTPDGDVFGPAKPSKPFKPAQELGRACLITTILLFALLIAMMLLLGSFFRPPFY